MTAISMRRAFPLLVIGVALAALLWLWALQAGGPGLREGGRISGAVEYTVRDASGALKDQGVLKNAVSAQGATDAIRRAFGAAGVFTSAAAATDDFNNIRVVCVTASANLGDPTTAAANGTATTGAKCTNVASGGNNPADAAFTAGARTDADPGSTTLSGVTFTASGSATIIEVQLVNGAPGAADGAIAAANVFAYRTVSIGLSADDTVTFTWTVDID